MSELWVTVRRYCTHSEREDCEYGSWSESWSNHLEGVFLSKGEERIAIDYDAKLGDDVYVLWAEYSTGDSFGRGSSNCVDVVHVFKTAAAAFAAKDALSAATQDAAHAVYKTDLGTEIRYYRPWCGYFEYLECLHVEKTWVQP